MNRFSSSGLRLALRSVSGAAVSLGVAQYFGTVTENPANGSAGPLVSRTLNMRAAYGRANFYFYLFRNRQKN